MTDAHLTELDRALTGAVSHFKGELAAIRSNRPSMELVENIRVTYFDQPMTIRQLASLSIVPPREIQITVWDQNAVGPIMNAIQDAQIGLGLSNSGTVIHATLSALTTERREELGKTVRKLAEAARIAVRTSRDDTNKALRAARDRKEITEDDERTLRESAQKLVDKANQEIEEAVDEKIESLAA